MNLSSNPKVDVKTAILLDYDSNEIVTNLKFDKIKLNIENSLNTNISTKEKKLQI